MPFQINNIKALGTQWDFEFFDEKNGWREVEKRVLKELIEFENKYSRFKDTSQLSILNRQRFLNNPSSELVQLLKFGLELNQKTDGYFNPFLGVVLENLGYDKNRTFIPKKSGKDSFENVKQTSYKQDEILEFDTQKVTFLGNENWDLGGYGKGFLVDKLGEIFEKDFGLKNFIINGGGDILVKGELNQELTLEDPFKEGFEYKKISLKNASLASSTTEKRNWKDSKSKQTFSHILNPIEKTSVTKMASFVIAKNAIEADVLATLMCLDLENKPVMKLLQKNFDFGFEVIKG